MITPNDIKVTKVYDNGINQIINLDAEDISAKVSPGLDPFSPEACENFRLWCASNNVLYGASHDESRNFHILERQTISKAVEQGIKYICIEHMS